MKDGHRYCVRISFVFFALQYYRFVNFLYMGRYISSLWYHTLNFYYLVPCLRKLCYQPLYLFYLQWKLSSRSEETPQLHCTGLIFQKWQYILESSASNVPGYFPSLEKAKARSVCGGIHLSDTVTNRKV